MKNKSVLIIEDDFDTQLFLEEVLKSEDINVDAFSHGKEALAHLEKGHIPGLIFMDLNFPFMSPEEFVEAFRKLPGNELTPIVLMSGKSNIEEYQVLLKAHSCLKKPFDLDALLNLVHELA